MNQYIPVLLELLKYLLPSIVVLISSYLIVKRFLVTDLQRKQVALLREGQDTTLRLRLGAYERLMLFTERIHPRYLIPRLYTPGSTVAELRTALLGAINTEFEHNLSQQLYVSRQVWETVKGVKEQELAMIHQIAAALPPEAPAADLQRRITDFLSNADSEMPTDVARQIIHDEARKVLGGGALA